MQRIKTYVQNLDFEYKDQYKHLIDYEKEKFDIQEIEHIIDQMRLVHYQLRYNLVVDDELLLFFDEF